MLRGVNKRIIEVNDTGSEMFEKALFIVKEDVASSSAQLQREAERVIVTYFNNEQRPPHQGFLRYTDLKKKRTKKVWFISALSVFLCVGMAVLMKFLL